MNKIINLTKEEWERVVKILDLAQRMPCCTPSDENEALHTKILRQISNDKLDPKEEINKYIKEVMENARAEDKHGNHSYAVVWRVAKDILTKTNNILEV